MSDEEPTSTVGMIKAMNKSSDGTNYMAESMKTFSMSEGKNKKGDVSVSTSDMGGALAAIKSMIQTAKQAAPEGSKKSNMWEFRASPHVAMGKTLDQTFISFLMWARTGFPGEEDEDEGATAGLINVSKAFRRLEAYAEWMEDSAEDLTAPLTFASVKAAVEAWQMKTSYDSHERLVWWIDLGRLDMPTIRATPVEDSFRAMVWFSHAVLFDAHAQQNGMVMCESLGRMGFYSMMTLVPMKLSAKIDRLTIGVLPVKMKLILCLDSPRWMSIMMKVRATLRARRRAPMTGCVKRAGSCSRLQHLTCQFPCSAYLRTLTVTAQIFGVFMSKKMRSRIKMKKQEWGYVAECFGQACIPAGFGECGGSLKEDPVLESYQQRAGAAPMEVS